MHLSIRHISYLLYRYWENTRIFPFTKKSFLLRAQWRYYFYLSRVRILVSPWLLTWLANYQNYKSSKSCVLCRNFISIYKKNRTLHGHLGIRILSSSAESISHSFALLTRERYFPHSKIKFVSPRGHVVSSIQFVFLLFFVVGIPYMCIIFREVFIRVSLISLFNYNRKKRKIKDLQN